MKKFFLVFDFILVKNTYLKPNWFHDGYLLVQKATCINQVAFLLKSNLNVFVKSLDENSCISFIQEPLIQKMKPQRYNSGDNLLS